MNRVPCYYAGNGCVGFMDTTDLPSKDIPTTFVCPGCKDWLRRFSVINKINDQAMERLQRKLHWKEVELARARKWLTAIVKLYPTIRFIRGTFDGLFAIATAIFRWRK